MEIKVFTEELKTVPKYIIHVDNTEVEHFITLFVHKLGESLDVKGDIYKGVLKHVVDAEITVDAQRISNELGYKKEKVEEVIGEIFRRSDRK